MFLHLKHIWMMLSQVQDTMYLVSQSRPVTGVWGKKKGETWLLLLI